MWKKVKVDVDSRAVETSCHGTCFPKPPSKKLSVPRVARVPRYKGAGGNRGGL